MGVKQRVARVRLRQSSVCLRRLAAATPWTRSGWLLPALLLLPVCINTYTHNVTLHCPHAYTSIQLSAIRSTNKTRASIVNVNYIACSAKYIDDRRSYARHASDSVLLKAPAENNNSNCALYSHKAVPDFFYQLAGTSWTEFINWILFGLQGRRGVANFKMWVDNERSRLGGWAWGRCFPFKRKCGEYGTVNLYIHVYNSLLNSVLSINLNLRWKLLTRCLLGADVHPFPDCVMMFMILWLFLCLCVWMFFGLL